MATNPSLDVINEILTFLDDVSVASLESNPNSGLQEQDFSLVSFNCLCRGNVIHDEFDNYRHIQDKTLIDWENNRRAVVLNQLKSFGAAIICVQEIECNDFDSYLGKSMEEAGYRYVLQDNPHVSEANRLRGNMGCAIFYLPEIFKLVGAPISRSRSVMSSFKHRNTGKILHVITCHLQGEPSRTKDRFGQIKSNMKYLRKLIKQNGVGSVVIAGDFNSTRAGAAYELLSTGELSPEFREYGYEVVSKKYSIEWTFKDAYALEPETPSFFSPFIPPSLLDFIFYFGDLEIQSTRKMYSKEQKVELDKQSLPNSWNGSDHVPIGCVFKIR